MRLGDVANAAATANGKPLDGVRVLAAEQMQALPYATQMLARLGADVVKVEHPVHGESGRSASPAMTDPQGRAVGATFLRNNLGKRSVGLDLKHPDGRALFLDLVPRFDVVAENFKAGTLDRLGLGYEALAAVHPGVIHVSLSGFGSDSPYRDWSAYASIVEAMSGIYQYKAGPDRPPVTIPVGALGDISSALFAVIGVLAALRHRDRTGRGQHVDIAMLDSMVAMADVVTNLWSLGVEAGSGNFGVICEGFRCADGYVVLQVGREHQFAKLAELVGHPEWVDDPRFAERSGWVRHLESTIRPAVEAWAGDRTKLAVAAELNAAGIAAGPSNVPEEVVHDPHVAAHDMLVEMPRTDGVEQPVLVPGNPVKMSGVSQGPEARVPWLGEHTDDVLAAELGLDGQRLAELRASGAIG